MIRLKKYEQAKGQKSRVLQFRLSKQDYGRLKQKAALYTEGNVSEWIRAAVTDYIPKVMLTNR
jgi:hypothetical protein